MKRMIRALLTIILAITTITVSSNISVKADTLDNVGVESNLYQFATAFLSEYYYAVDQYTDYSFGEYIQSSTLLDYVNNKVEGKRYRAIVYGTDDMENYVISFSLRDIEDSNGNVILSVLAEANYNYKGADFDSAYSEVNHLLISEGTTGYEILDWYIPADYYDVSLRGENVVLNSGYWNTAARNITTCSDTQEELNSNIRDYYEDLLAQTKWTESDFEYLTTTSVETVASALYSLDRDAMVTWAYNNYNQAQPQSGNSEKVGTYYDFSEISGNYDCTNFVSHALLAGGAEIYDTGNDEISATGWYYTNLSDRSSSWSGVREFYDFVTTNTTKGPAGTYLEYTSIYAPSSVFPYTYGDILQFHSGSVWRHSTIITGYALISGSNTMLEATVTARTNDESNYKNRRQSEIYVGKDRRIIKLSGYYK